MQVVRHLFDDFFLILYRIAAHFTCEDVLQLVTGDTSGDSEGESEEELDFESGPLDRELEVDLASNMSPLISCSGEHGCNCQ